MSIKDILDVGADHPYDCRCLICLDFWVIMGPDNEADPPNYGPFSVDEVQTRARETDREFIDIAGKKE